VLIELKSWMATFSENKGFFYATKC
jgi:hypothetical protein